MLFLLSVCASEVCWFRPIHVSQVSAAADRPAWRSASRTDFDGQCDKLVWPRPSPVCHTDHPSKLTAPETISRSGDIFGANQNLNGSRDLNTPLSWLFAICGQARATVDLRTRFEVSNSTHHKDMKGVTKCWNVVVWGSYDHPRSLEIAPIDRAHTRSY